MISQTATGAANSRARLFRLGRAAPIRLGGRGIITGAPRRAVGTPTCRPSSSERSPAARPRRPKLGRVGALLDHQVLLGQGEPELLVVADVVQLQHGLLDRKSTRLNSSH